MSSKINFDNKSNIMDFAGVPTAGHSARSSSWYALLVNLSPRHVSQPVGAVVWRAHLAIL